MLVRVFFVVFEPLGNAKVVVYGTIIALMCVPVLVAYTPIIFASSSYKDPANAEVMSLLVKRMLFSSVVHQLVFSLKSGK